MGTQRKSSRGSPTPGAHGGFREFLADGPRGAPASRAPLIVLTGLTGSGKSAALAALARSGQQVLDLQRLAAHRGSSFGGFGLPPQPSHLAFQAAVHATLDRADPRRPLWIEQCPPYLGSVGLPYELIGLMAEAPHVELRRTRSHRVSALVREYGPSPEHEWLGAVNRIAARLGSVREPVREAVLAGRLPQAVDLLLDYYDRGYRLGRSSHQEPLAVVGPCVGDDEMIARACLCACAGQAPSIRDTGMA